MLRRVFLCAALLVPCVTSSGAAADDIKAAARDVLSKNQDAIIQVKLTAKVGSVDQQIEVAGTVISPAGLTVVSDVSTNPRGLLGGGEEGGRTETTDVKLVLKDGKEIPGKFVLRDRDLDLAFVMPKDSKDLKLTHVKLEKTPVPEVLDELVYLHRLGKALNREVSVVLGRAEAVVKKPRVLIVPELWTGLQRLGCPVFDASGRAVGLVVMRRAGAGQSGGGGLLGAMQPVIVTTEDLLQIVGQVDKPQEEGK
jgi:hypothetical protein